MTCYLGKHSEGIVSDTGLYHKDSDLLAKCFELEGEAAWWCSRVSLGVGPDQPAPSDCSRTSPLYRGRRHACGAVNLVQRILRSCSWRSSGAWWERPGEFLVVVRPRGLPGFGSDYVRVRVSSTPSSRHPFRHRSRAELASSSWVRSGTASFGLPRTAFSSPSLPCQTPRFPSERIATAEPRFALLIDRAQHGLDFFT